MNRWIKRLAIPVGGSVLAILTAIVPYFEGTELDAYQDSAGFWTICTGHTLTAKPGMTATPKQCDALFKSDIGKALDAVDENVAVPISTQTRAALASFVFNVGVGAFENSTLLRLLNNAQYRDACNQLSRWVYADGKQLAGLVKRREAERELCLAGLEH